MLGRRETRENGFAKSDKSLLHFFIALKLKQKKSLNPRFSSTQAGAGAKAVYAQQPNLIIALKKKQIFQ
jgi:hypothetical protein